MLRPAVEHYARCTVTVGELVYEPGLELRAGDDLPRLLENLAGLVPVIADRVEWLGRLEALRTFGDLFESLWPGRAWFVEIHDAEDNSWTQSYQPYGIPRNQETA